MDLEKIFEEPQLLTDEEMALTLNGRLTTVYAKHIISECVHLPQSEEEIDNGEDDLYDIIKKMSEEDFVTFTKVPYVTVDNIEETIHGILKVNLAFTHDINHLGFWVNMLKEGLADTKDR